MSNIKSPEYGVWRSMKSRCSNEKVPTFNRYGGRGIKVCERWLKFKNFMEDMGPRPSTRHWLERKDNNRDYEKDNCMWALPAEQARNKANNVWCVFKGRRVLASDLVLELGQPLRWVRSHIVNGVFSVTVGDLPTQSLREKIFPMEFEI